MWSSSSSVGCCYCVCILIREYREAHVRAHISHSPFSHTNTYTYTMSIGVPIKLLHEAEKHIVTVELKTGDIYRGQLVEAEDNMNCQLANITYTARDGRRSTLEYAFIRGSKRSRSWKDHRHEVQDAIWRRCWWRWRRSRLAEPRQPLELVDQSNLNQAKANSHSHRTIKQPFISIHPSSLSLFSPAIFYLSSLSCENRSVCIHIT